MNRKERTFRRHARLALAAAAVATAAIIGLASGAQAQNVPHVQHVPRAITQLTQLTQIALTTQDSAAATAAPSTQAARAGWWALVPDLGAPRSRHGRSGEPGIHGVPLDESLRNFCAPIDYDADQQRSVRTSVSRPAIARAIA